MIYLGIITTLLIGLALVKNTKKYDNADIILILNIKDFVFFFGIQHRMYVSYNEKLEQPKEVSELSIGLFFISIIFKFYNP